MTSKKDGLKPPLNKELLTVVTTATIIIVTAAYEEDNKNDNPFAAAVIAKIKTAHESFASFLPSLIFYENRWNLLQIWTNLKYL